MGDVRQLERADLQEMDMRLGALGGREGDGLLERLDQFYVCDWVVGRGGQSGIVPGTTLLEHSPAIL